MAQGLLAEPRNKLREKPSLLGALRDPLFYKDMANNLAGLLGTPTPTKAESDAVLSMIRMGPSVMQSYPSRERELMQSHDNKLMSLAQMAAPITYHGSPHKFDAFDSSKIGTGEGAQAYGHGLYLADNPGVAKNYRDVLSNTASREVKHVADEWIARANGDRTKARSLFAKYMADNDMGGETFARKVFDALDPNPGALYTVDLPDEAVSKMLDWDKPLSQQAGVASMLDALQSSPQLPAGFGKAIAAARARPHFDGNDLYAELVKVMPNNQVADVMKRAGFTGIRYLDGGSRGQGKGTSNYVVFDDKLPKILKRE